MASRGGGRKGRGMKHAHRRHGEDGGGGDAALATAVHAGAVVMGHARAGEVLRGCGSVQIVIAKRELQGPGRQTRTHTRLTRSWLPWPTMMGTWLPSSDKRSVSSAHLDRVPVAYEISPAHNGRGRSAQWSEMRQRCTRSQLTHVQRQRVGPVC